jgi:hypothetical protein
MSISDPPDPPDPPKTPIQVSDIRQKYVGPVGKAPAQAQSLKKRKSGRSGSQVHKIASAFGNIKAGLSPKKGRRGTSSHPDHTSDRSSSPSPARETFPPPPEMDFGAGDDNMVTVSFNHPWSGPGAGSRSNVSLNTFQDANSPDLLTQLHTALEEACQIVERLEYQGAAPETINKRTAEYATKVANFATNSEWKSPRDMMGDVLTLLNGVADNIKDVGTRVDQMDNEIKGRLDTLEKKTNGGVPRVPTVASTPLDGSAGNRAAAPSQPSLTTKKAPSNPLSAHHPSRLVVQILPNGIPKEQRPDDAVLVADINKSLMQHTASKHLRVVSVKWNGNGNCILFTRADQTAQELAKHAQVFQHLLGKGRKTETRADERWYKIQVNDIRTGAFDGPPGTPSTVFTAEQIHQELADKNPHYAKLSFVQKPRWMRREDDLRTTARSSVVFAITDENAANHLIRDVKYLAAFGRNVSLRRYADKSPVVQCTRCYRYDHVADKCKNETRCRLCDGKHTAQEHQEKCPDCREARSELDAMRNEDDQPIELPSCTHNLKCAHCPDDQDRNHPSDHRRCPVRVRRYGTSRTGERPTRGGVADEEEVAKKKATSGRNAKPAEKKTHPELPPSTNRFSLLTDDAPGPSTANVLKALADAGQNIDEATVAKALEAIAAQATSR